ncbi:MAG TPA: peroxiredoxin [Candidatus Thermoplasmatota archaeon]|nr:peroxiredoxin [Candidatus Thermoplasmatota archaeon]
MEKNHSIKVSDAAPDFTLEDQNGRRFKLSDFKGKIVVLSFHPLAWTPVCSKQMKSLENNKERFDAVHTIAVGISVDSVPCKNAWAKDLAIEHTRLLSDFWPHGEVSQCYGLFYDKDGFSMRANVIVDENQKVAWVKVYPTSQVPDINEVLRVLEGMTKTKQ